MRAAKEQRVTSSRNTKFNTGIVEQLLVLVATSILGKSTGHP
jgi:hypothetical protein